ncbi:MAG: hypothetical protein RID11_19635 [Roseovarius sp.]|uniref:hypothetical protein n=1 Tax=Roseovarius sp. TaxID=1486281 RepID=UPI0032EF8D64
MAVRDWLAGQGWYDMTQYRMLPPEGLDLHWSRYVDLGIAALIWPLTFIFTQTQAEAAALVIWPSLLLIGLLSVTGWGGRRAFGPLAAMIAIVAVMIWPPTGANYFHPARIDHHNVQILLTTLIIATLLHPSRPRLMGAIGGFAAALSLAVGLEMLLTIAIAGMILAARVVTRRSNSDEHLTSFALALALGAPLLFAGQTPAHEWALLRCDELSAPYIAVTSLGALICVVLVWLAPRLPGWVSRAGLLIAMSVGGLAMLYPLIAPCFSGPYGSLSPEVNDLITRRILEARPALPQVLAGEVSVLNILVPALSSVLFGSGLWGLAVWRGTATSAQNRALGTLLIFGWLGVIASLFQVRLILMGAAAIPLLTGYVLASLLAARKASGNATVPTLAFLAAFALTLLSPTVFAQAKRYLAPTPLANGGAMTAVALKTCRDPEILRSLTHVAPGLVLASSNISAPILLLTDHEVLTGPYHRSEDAIIDGLRAFERGEAVLRETLARTDADYLLLCRDASYGPPTSFATTLAQGADAPGLTPVSGVDPKLLLLRVAKP